MLELKPMPPIKLQQILESMQYSQYAKIIEYDSETKKEKVIKYQPAYQLIKSKLFGMANREVYCVEADNFNTLNIYIYPELIEPCQDESK